MEKVSVNRGLLAALVAVAAVALLAVAFLLGRSSGSGRPTEVPEQGRTVAIYSPETRSTGEPSLAAATAEAPASYRPAEPPPSEAAGAFPSDRAGSEGAAPGQAPVVGAPSSADPSTIPTDPAAEAVARYLDAVDRIQPANLNGSPESVATEMAGALARGDTSGLDAMIRQTEDAKGRLAALRPPAPCAAHYDKTLESLDDAIGMLRALKSSMQSSDPVAGLASVQARAATLQTRAEALQHEDRALRQRYGLTR